MYIYICIYIYTYVYQYWCASLLVQLHLPMGIAPDVIDVLKIDAEGSASRGTHRIGTPWVAAAMHRSADRYAVCRRRRA